MDEFKVLGPYVIPMESLKAGKSPDEEQIRRNWSGPWKEFGDKRGCYIFAKRAAKGYIPFYAGKTTRAFKNECFTADKLFKLMRGIARSGAGTPVLFLVLPTKGKGNAKNIGEIEDDLIEIVQIKNPELENDKGTKAPDWSIAGVIRAKKGKKSKPAVELCKALGLIGNK